MFALACHIHYITLYFSNILLNPDHILYSYLRFYGSSGIVSSLAGLSALPSAVFDDQSLHYCIREVTYYKPLGTAKYWLLFLGESYDYNTLPGVGVRRTLFMVLLLFMSRPYSL